MRDAVAERHGAKKRTLRGLEVSPWNTWWFFNRWVPQCSIMLEDFRRVHGYLASFVPVPVETHAGIGLYSVAVIGLDSQTLPRGAWGDWSGCASS